MTIYSIFMCNFPIFKASLALNSVALSCEGKVCRFHSLSGHMLGLWDVPRGEYNKRGNQSMFLSHIDVSLPLSIKINK